MLADFAVATLAIHHSCCRVQQLRLLSKLEQAGLLTLLEKNGVTLTFIEKSGLLSKAESLGLLSAAADRCDPKNTAEAPDAS